MITSSRAAAAPRHLAHVQPPLEPLSAQSYGRHVGAAGVGAWRDAFAGGILALADDDDASDQGAPRLPYVAGDATAAPAAAGVPASVTAACGTVPSCVCGICGITMPVDKGYWCDSCVGDHTAGSVCSNCCETHPSTLTRVSSTVGRPTSPGRSLSRLVAVS